MHQHPSLLCQARSEAICLLGAITEIRLRQGFPVSLSFLADSLTVLLSTKLSIGPARRGDSPVRLPLSHVLAIVPSVFSRGLYWCGAAFLAIVDR